MDTIPLTSLNRLLLSTFLKNCTFCHNSRDKKGTFTFEEYQQIKNENVEIINDDSTYRSSATCPTSLQNPSLSMPLSKSYMTSSTRLPQRPGMTAPMFSVHFS